MLDKALLSHALPSSVVALQNCTKHAQDRQHGQQYQLQNYGPRHRLMDAPSPTSCACCASSAACAMALYSAVRDMAVTACSCA